MAGLTLWPSVQSTYHSLEEPVCVPSKTYTSQHFLCGKLSLWAPLGIHPKHREDDLRGCLAHIPDSYVMEKSEKGNDKRTVGVARDAAASQLVSF